MRSLVIFYNDTERWVHILTCDVDSQSGDHKVVGSVTLFPPGHLLTFAGNYHETAGVSRERVNIFRTEKVMTGNDTWRN